MNREQRAALSKEGKWAKARAQLPQGDIPPGAAGIGRRILIARVLRKISQRDLAKQIDVSPQLIVWWEVGKSYPDVEQVEKLAAAFGDVKPGTLAKWLSIFEEEAPGPEVVGEHKGWTMFRGSAIQVQMHQHLCDICGFLWMHCKRQVARMTPEGKARAHRCPNCGKTQRVIDEG